MVGELVRVGLYDSQPDHIRALLSKATELNLDRRQGLQYRSTKSALPAPAHGLFLEQIHY